MPIDRAACQAFWQAYLAQLPPGHPHHARRPEAFAFGDSAALADELAQLVLTGRKQATTSLGVEFTAVGDPLPRAGDVCIVLRGDAQPVAVIELTDVTTRPFGQVDATYAAIEGEGDGSLAHWRAGHVAYFNGVCRRLGGQFDESTPVICQVFKLCWRGPVEIRDARVDDIPTLVTMARGAFRDTYRGLDDPDEIEDYVMTQLTPEYFAPHVGSAASCLLLAVHAGQLLGYALVTQSEPPPCVRAVAPIELARLYLHADVQGQGLGRLLMQAVQARARRFGADAIWLGVYDRNKRAREFYQRWGFVDVGTKAFWFGGVAYQDPVMCAPLDNAR